MNSVHAGSRKALCSTWNRRLQSLPFILGRFCELDASAIESKPYRAEFNPDSDVRNSFIIGRALDIYPPIATVKKLHSMIIVCSLHFDPHVAVKLMRAYAACGDPASTRHLFDDTADKTVIFFNVMIRSYANNELYLNALAIFETMIHDGVKPDHYTFPCALAACSAAEKLCVGLQIHAAVMVAGLSSNIFIGNTLITMYTRCKSLSDAARAFNEMPSKDTITWNSMIAGYTQTHHFDEALDLCKEMEAKNQSADAGTLASLMPAVVNATSASVSFIRELFDKMPQKSLISWNTMIAIYVSNSLAAEAVELFSRMRAHGIPPDSVTLASVLPACGDLSALALGTRIHEYTKIKRLDTNIFLANALVDMYAKCGCLKAAREVFDKMEARDVVSWTSIISAYGMHGHGKEAVNLFCKMRESGLKPDAIAFVSVLSACSHSGLLKDGRYYFSCMTEEYQIIPKMEHYACMVDLFGRAGELEQAYEFIRHMPVDPNERVWGAMLGACRVSSNMNLGLVAADNLFRMVPEQAGYYVLLSNIYARAGRWDAVMSVRRMMSRRGIKKLPGCSNVELQNRVYTFLAGDQSHPQSNDIYLKLDFLVQKMKEAGYVPNIDSALHDVEEEEKENHLVVHSEKLAVAFVLLNTEPGTPVRITKNLRICEDCHCAVKLISKITQREIVLRDTNRFHHFENGACSCGDYW